MHSRCYALYKAVAVCIGCYIFEGIFDDDWQIEKLISSGALNFAVLACYEMLKGTLEKVFNPIFVGLLRTILYCIKQLSAELRHILLLKGLCQSLRVDWVLV